ncbi:MAG: ribosome maturation factor RimP [Desulfuromonadales bacterium]|nr:ribosome maturation factor RimP [Desulfuromonadales bacterium]
MKHQSILDQLTDLITPILDDLGLELVDLEYKREGRDLFLRIFIDKTGGVNLDDCAGLSREVSALLEVENLITDAYRLEVSSPGMDRPLKRPADFSRFVGERVKIKSKESIDPDGRGHNRKTFVGELLGLKEGRVSIRQLDKRGGEIEILLTDLDQARLDPEF